MTFFPTLIVVVFIALFIWCLMIAIVGVTDSAICTVNHWRVRRWGHALRCSRCGEFVHSAYHEPNLFTITDFSSGRLSAESFNKGENQ